MQGIKIKINNEQYAFLQKLIEKQSVFVSLLSVNGDDVVIEIPEDDAEKISDLACGYLDVHGFDDKYELTDSGRLAENLIDVLYR